jgi:hypothetical protein
VSSVLTELLQMVVFLLQLLQLIERVVPLAGEGPHLALQSHHLASRMLAAL